jgi:hypothetical protein
MAWKRVEVKKILHYSQLLKLKKSASSFPRKIPGKETLMVMRDEDSESVSD